jgi:predicted NBD/HSP70 family sugar kinase
MIGRLEGKAEITDGEFSTLSMLISDGSLAGDEPTLRDALDGMQRLYFRSALPEMQKGRLRGLLDVAHWSLRRMPSTLQLKLDGNTHAARFLRAVARKPGLSNQDLATALRIDETEVSRVGRRLQDSGLVWRRKEWRTNAWDLTPRGEQCLLSSARPLDHAVGVSLRSDRLAAVLIDRDGRKLAAQSRDWSAEPSPQLAVQQVKELAQELMGRAGVDRSVGVGVSVDGRVSERGVVMYAPGSPPVPTWQDVPLADMISEAVQLPTAVENNANALADYERRHGSGTRTRDFATILLADGAGCGMVAGGLLLRGHSGSAGALGHLNTERGGGGVLLHEDITPAAMERRMRDGAGKKYCLPEINELIDDDAVTEALDHAGGLLGDAIADLLAWLDPAEVVLYGPRELVEATPRNPAAQRFINRVEQASRRGPHPAAARFTLIPKALEEGHDALAVAEMTLHTSHAAEPAPAR